MKLTIRRKLSSVVLSKATAICVLFVAVMAVLTYVLWQSRPTEPGTMQTLFTAAAAAPAVGIVIAVLSWLGTMWKRSRPVAAISETVVIRPTGQRFPASELAQVTVFSRGGSSFGMLVPRKAGVDGQPYTFEFPKSATKKPHEVADAFEAHRPDVLVQRLGSI